MSNTIKPLVSIHCLVYNHGPYIRQCLDGFLMQKTNFVFEAIVHDDCSNDNSTEIIREYVEKYPNIIKSIFETENQYSKIGFAGIFKIMNEYTRGKYVAFCEGDDYWIDPNKLQKQIDYMELHAECMLCGSNGLILTENGVRRPEYFNMDFQSRIINLDEIIGHWHFPSCSLMYRKNMDDNYPRWSENIYSGDQTRILLAGIMGTIYSIGEVTCVYRKMPNNPYSLTNFTSKNHLFELNEHIKLYTYFREEAPQKYYDTITKHIEKLLKEKRYILLSKKFLLFPYFFMPLYSYRRLVFRIFPSIVKRWIHRIFKIDILKQNQFN